MKAVWALALLCAGVAACLGAATPSEWLRACSTAFGLDTAPFLLLLLLPAVGYFVKMVGWRSLLPTSARPGLGRAYATFVAAQSVNELGMAILGEPLKVMVLPREQRAAGLRAVVADNLIALAALFAALATLACWSGAALPGPVAAAGGLVAPLVLLVIVAGTRSLVVGRPGAILAAFTAHYLGKLWLVVEIGLGLSFLGQPALATCAPLSLAWSGAATIGAAVPGQLGVVEAALLHGGASLGLATPALLALAFIRRLRAALWLMLGLFLAARIVTRSTEEVSHVSTTTA